MQMSSEKLQTSISVCLYAGVDLLASWCDTVGDVLWAALNMSSTLATHILDSEKLNMINITFLLAVYAYSVIRSSLILQKYLQFGPPQIWQNHQISRAGCPVVHRPEKLISNPEVYTRVLGYRQWWLYANE